MIKTTTNQMLITILGLCLTMTTVGCNNGFDTPKSASVDTSSVSTSGSTARVKRSESFFNANKNSQPTGQSPQGNVTAHNASKNPSDTQTMKAPSASPTSTTNKRINDAVTPETKWKKNLNHQKNVDQASVKASSVVNVATLVPAASAVTLDKYLVSKKTKIGDQTALTISEVDMVLANAKKYLQEFANIDLTDEETKNATTQNIQGLYDMFGAMIDQSTGVEKNKVAAKLVHQHQIFSGVGSMIKNGKSGHAIFAWVNAIEKQSPAGSILSLSGGEVDLSYNMGIVYCFVQGKQTGSPVSDLANCEKAAHTDVELARVLDYLLADLNSGQVYASDVAKSILKISSEPQKMPIYLRDDEQNMIKKISHIIKSQANFQIFNDEYAMNKSNAKGKK